MCIRVLLLILLGFVEAVHGQTPNRIFVSAAGSDSNEGSFEMPLRTLQKAKMVVRERKAQIKKGKIEVLLRGGTYFLDKPFTLTLEDSGDSLLAIHYRAYKDEKVTISGGRKVTGKWVRHQSGKNIWKIKISSDFMSFHSLYADKRHLKRSSSDTLFTEGPLPGYKGKYSKFDFRGISALKTDSLAGFAGFKYAGTDLNNLSDLENAELIIYNSWEASWHNIAQIDTVHHSILLSNPMRYPIGYFSDRHRYRIENVMEYLDADDEWFFDKKSRELYYYAPTGLDPNGIDFVVPMLENLIKISGSQTTPKPVKNISFQNLSFRHSRSRWGINDVTAKQKSANVKKFPWLDFSKGFSSAQMSLQCGQSVLLQNASYCSFEQCEFSDLENYAIRIGEYSKRNKIEKCQIHDVGGGGIILGFDDRDPIKRGIPKKMSPGFNKVLQTTIDNIGILHPSGVGIAILQANNSLIKNNRITNTPYSGISCGWTFNSSKNYTSNNLIEGNYISNVMKVLADGGGIYTLGSQVGTIFRLNYITNVGRSTNAVGATNHGFFFDQSSSDFTVQDNIVLNVQNQDIKFNKSDKSRIEIRGNFFEKSTSDIKVKEKVLKKLKDVK